MVPCSVPLCLRTAGCLVRTLAAAPQGTAVGATKKLTNKLTNKLKLVSAPGGPPVRARIVLFATLLAVAGALAFADPLVTDDAEEHCVTLRDAGTVDDTSDDLQVCREDVWFHDVGTKVDNVDNAQGTFATWNTNPPTTSVTGGAGGGVVATSLSHQFNEPYDERESFVAAGRHVGAIDAVAVELYLFPPVGMAQGETSFRVDARLEVDGQSVSTISDRTVEMETAGDAVQRIRFAFTGLVERIEDLHDLELVEALDAEHELRLTVHGTGVATNGAVFVYDTTEVPAGMVINPPQELLAELG